MQHIATAHPFRWLRIAARRFTWKLNALLAARAQPPDELARLRRLGAI